MYFTIAGIDVHKAMLVVAVATIEAQGEITFEGRRFGASTAELRHLAAWLQSRGVREVVMESTAQYWRPVWAELRCHFRLFLAQAHSNRAPRGRKTDCEDAQRLARRYIAGELCLSFVPDAEQQGWRTLTRGKLQMVRDRGRVLAQVEALLEETRIKLATVVSDLWGASGQRILRAIAEGEQQPEQLASLADARLKVTPEKLREALAGKAEPVHCFLLRNHLQRLDLLDKQIENTNQQIAAQLAAHRESIQRLAKVPGIRVDAAQQIVAEVGADAAAFPSPGHLSSWAGACPGRQESAGVSRSDASPKGNPFLRRLLCQAAQAAVRTKGCHFQIVFQKLMPRLGYAKAIWAIAHKLCGLVWIVLHDKKEYKEFGSLLSEPARKRRLQRLAKELRIYGYSVTAPSRTTTSAAATLQ
jgi:transposase